jgi:hypothetical protein
VFLIEFQDSISKVLCIPPLFPGSLGTKYGLELL